MTTEDRGPLDLNRIPGIAASAPLSFASPFLDGELNIRTTYELIHGSIDARAIGATPGVDHPVDEFGPAHPLEVGEKRERLVIGDIDVDRGEGWVIEVAHRESIMSTTMRARKNGALSWEGLDGASMTQIVTHDDDTAIHRSMRSLSRPGRSRHRELHRRRVVLPLVRSGNEGGHRPTPRRGSRDDEAFVIRSSH
jgi:hypothetical protein